LSELRAALVTPLTGSLARFGRESAAALTLWAEHAADLPPSWTGVDLDVLDADPNPGAAMRAAIEARPDVLFGPYGSSTTVAAAGVTDRAVWNHGGATSRLSRPAFPHVINVLSPASSYFAGTSGRYARRTQMSDPCAYCTVPAVSAGTWPPVP
jgi:branched-chain amino acid transport system substrate-binding protein